MAGHLRDGVIFSDGSSSSAPAAAAPAAASASMLALAPRQLEPSDLMFGGAPISGVPEAEATATVHACLRAGIRHYDTAPLYGDSEDKLGAALRSATLDSCGAEVTFAGSTGMEVGGDPIYIYTKTGRLVREWVNAESGLGWRPAGLGADGAEQWPAVGGRRIVTDDFSANGAFLSHSESRQRLGGDLRVDTLRIHDADTVGGLGATQATGALDQALLPEGMLAGMTALKQDGTSHSHSDQTSSKQFWFTVMTFKTTAVSMAGFGQQSETEQTLPLDGWAGSIANVSLGMNAHRQHRTVAQGPASWTPAVINDFVEAAPKGTFSSALLAYGESRPNHIVVPSPSH